MSTKHTTGAIRKHVLKSADITVDFATGAILTVAGENLTVRVEIASVPVISRVNFVITHLSRFLFTAKLFLIFTMFLTTSLAVHTNLK